MDPLRCSLAEEEEEEEEDDLFPFDVPMAPLPTPPPPSDVPDALTSLLLPRERVLFGPVECEFGSTEHSRGSRGDALVTSYRLLLVARRRVEDAEPEPARGALAGGYASLGEGSAQSSLLAYGKGVSRGFKEGLEGLVSKPMDGLRHGGVVGLVKGLGKGLYGVAASPTLGALAAGAASRERAHAAAARAAGDGGAARGPVSITLPIGNIRTMRGDRRTCQLRIKCHDPWKLAIDLSAASGGASEAGDAPSGGGDARPQPQASAGGGDVAVQSADEALAGLILWTREQMRALGKYGAFACEGGGVSPERARATQAALAAALRVDWHALVDGVAPVPVGGALVDAGPAPAAPLARAAAALPPPLWRASDWNRAHGRCATYPELVAVPAAVDDATLDAASRFRARGRAPVLCWRARAAPGARGAALLRSAQPLVGATDGSRSAADEALLAAAAAATPVGVLYILDLRASLAASANRVVGGGSEDRRCYPFAEPEFCDVPNAQAARAAYARLRALATERGAVVAAVAAAAAADGGAAGAPLTQRAWLERVHATGWLAHCGTLLRAASRAAALCSAGAAVLVHCSDGWDRTTQVVSLALLLLEPRYRTARGLATLLAREWGKMGFRFKARAGLARAPSDGDRTAPTLPPSDGESEPDAPILVQWLDCVHQLSVQFPRAFEFSSRLLVALADAARSGRYGDFLANSEAERAALAAEALCAPPSFWCEALELDEGGRLGAVAPAYANRSFAPGTDPMALAPLVGGDAGASGPPQLPQPLQPATAARTLCLWEGHFLRHVSRGDILQFHASSA